MYKVYIFLIYYDTLFLFLTLLLNIIRVFNYLYILLFEDFMLKSVIAAISCYHNRFENKKRTFVIFIRLRYNGLLVEEVCGRELNIASICFNNMYYIYLI